MKTYKVKVTYTDGTTLFSTLEAKGKESLKEEIKRFPTTFMLSMLEVKDIEILSNKIDKKLIGKFNKSLMDLGDYFESENDFLEKVCRIFEEDGFTMMNIPSGNNMGDLSLINKNEDVVENYTVHYVSTRLEDRKNLPYEIIKYNCFM
jgi:CO dehydrogenase/acetyl-CoA synthase epsilon subunit